MVIETGGAIRITLDDGATIVVHAKPRRGIIRYWMVGPDSIKFEAIRSEQTRSKAPIGASRPRPTMMNRHA